MKIPRMVIKISVVGISVSESGLSGSECKISVPEEKNGSSNQKFCFGCSNYVSSCLFIERDTDTPFSFCFSAARKWTWM